MTPTVVSQSAGTARIAWQTAWDQDNTALTYAVTRDGSTTSISTQTVNSAFYNRPSLSFLDKGLTPGSTHTYRVRVTDPLGNTVQSPSTSVTIGSETTDAYSAMGLADGAQTFWPLSESAGSALAYDHAGGADLTIDRDRDKNQVVALREIADQTVKPKELQEAVVTNLQKVRVDEEDETEELASISEAAEALRLTAAAPPRPTPSGGDYD